MTAALALQIAGEEAPALSSTEVPRQLARLVVVDRARPAIRVADFTALPQLLRAGDLVVVNDAATLPASLDGHTADGAAFELRLAGPIDGVRLTGVLLGAGDYHTRTEHRPPPPALRLGERVTVGAIAAAVANVAGRLVALDADRDGDALWQALYANGAPVQYAHRRERLPLWSVQTAYAARPWAAEMPSAGRSLTWDVLLGLRRAGVTLARLTHAAGLSSTGDAALDRALPWPERYEIPERHISRARRCKGARRSSHRDRARRWCARSKHPAERPVPASRRCGSDPSRRSASSTASSAACTSRARATSSCCARSRHAAGCSSRSMSRRRITCLRTSSATRACCCDQLGDGTFTGTLPAWQPDETSSIHWISSSRAGAVT